MFRLSTTSEAATSVTAVSPIVDNIVTPLAVCLLFSLGNDLQFSPLNYMTCVRAEGEVRRGAVDSWLLLRPGKITLLPVVDCSDSRQSY